MLPQEIENLQSAEELPAALEEGRSCETCRQPLGWENISSPPLTGTPLGFLAGEW